MFLAALRETLVVRIAATVINCWISHKAWRETQEYVRRISARYNSISDPHYIQTVRKASSSTLAKSEHKSRPLTVYEPSPVAVRTADGKRMLVNQ